MTEQNTPATSAGTTSAAGEGVDDQELAREVAEQTSSDLQVEQVFENEADTPYTDKEVQKAEAEELGG
ncbi:MAG: hypothetical protein M3P46_07570 [Actinomycetota bacterium]|nr:hypothetical protein [Actinomycetota bacterium]